MKYEEDAEINDSTNDTNSELEIGRALKHKKMEISSPCQTEDEEDIFASIPPATDDAVFIEKEIEMNNNKGHTNEPSFKGNEVDNQTETKIILEPVSVPWVALVAKEV